MNRDVGIPANPKGGLSDANAWGSFFKGNSTEGVRLGYKPSNLGIGQAAIKNGYASSSILPIAGVPTSAPFSVAPPAPEMMGGGTQLAAVPSADEYLGNVINSSREYLKRFAV